MNPDRFRRGWRSSPLGSFVGEFEIVHGRLSPTFVTTSSRLARRGFGKSPGVDLTPELLEGLTSPRLTLHVIDPYYRKC